MVIPLAVDRRQFLRGVTTHGPRCVPACLLARDEFERTLLVGQGHYGPDKDSTRSFSWILSPLPAWPVRGRWVRWQDCSRPLPAPPSLIVSGKVQSGRLSVFPAELQEPEAP